MERYNRINLALLKTADDDLEVFDIINSQRNKTEYVVKAVKFYEANKLEVSRKELVSIVEEAIRNIGIVQTMAEVNPEVADVSDITDEILNCFDNL
ncbi:hypothetical protein [Petrocella sp. FN5]|uniref:hypothetical protein n=1 Tax=Petrocella sp. FN5 TaxID=3032002 RepID=UPI0023D9A227|nr:hypothetical protein [Petrocella sp. FN5]MDF1618558.1 hypothetical protein [Petrocella sp. FN5]